MKENSKNPTKKRNRVTIGEFKTPPKTQKCFIIDAQSPSESPRRRASAPILSHHRQIFIDSAASPDSSKISAPDSSTTHYQGLDILDKTQEMRRTQARFSVESKDVTFICGINRFSDENLKNSAKEQNCIKIGEFKTPPKTQKCFIIDAQSPLESPRRRVSAPILSHRRQIFIDSAASPDSSKRSAPDSSTTHHQGLDILDKMQEMRRTQARFSVEPKDVTFICGINRFSDENYEYMKENSKNSAKEQNCITIGEFKTPPKTHKHFVIDAQSPPESPICKASTPILSHRQRIFIGSAASPDPSERSAPDSPTTQHQGLHGGLDILHKMQEMRRTQARFNINVEPKDVTFICGINRFSDENYEYMIRVNNGTTNLSALTGSIQLQIFSFDVSPISSFKNPLLLANVTYEGSSTQSLTI